MDLFCFGSLEQYNKAKPSYLDLTPAQLHKLKMVSVLRLCACQKLVSYDLIREKAELKSDGEVVGLLLEAMMGGLMRGRINEKERKLKVFDVVGLGLSPGDLAVFKGEVGEENKRIHSLRGSLRAALQEIATSKSDEVQIKKSLFSK